MALRMHDPVTYIPPVSRPCLVLNAERDRDLHDPTAGDAPRNHNVKDPRPGRRLEPRLARYECVCPAFHLNIARGMLTHSPVPVLRVGGYEFLMQTCMSQYRYMGPSAYCANPMPSFILL